MTAVKIPSSSREYLKVGPHRLREGGSLADITTNTIEFAFTETDADPDDGEWIEGSWEEGRGRVFSRCLVGAGGGTILAEGTWFVWNRLTRDTEMIVRRTPNRLVIT